MTAIKFKIPYPQWLEVQRIARDLDKPVDDILRHLIRVGINTMLTASS